MNETTPKYIIEFKNELKKDISGLRNELKGEISGLRNEVKGEISGLRNEFKHELRSEISGLRNEITGKLDEIIEKQDMHFETIGELKVQVTGIELMLKKKASYEHVKDLEKGLEKLKKLLPFKQSH